MTNVEKIDWKNIEVKDLAGLIANTFRNDGIEVILVGGACVTIYSINRYMSYDLDYISYEDKKQIKKSLEKIGFIEKNKHFVHPECPYLIDFVTPPAAVGKEMIHNFEELLTEFGSFKLLKDVDCVKDRLASFYHWNDKQGLEQAIEVCLERSIDLDELKNWSENENFIHKFQVFLTALSEKANS